MADPTATKKSPSPGATSPKSGSGTASPPPAAAAAGGPSTADPPPPPGRPAEATHTIDVDDDDATSDDGYGSSASVSAATTSISSSVRDSTFENNRRYHKFREGRYQFPNDEPEQEREDMKHAMIVHLCGGKLHFAPIDGEEDGRGGGGGGGVKDILDVGTGTGIWAIDVGDEYPEANVLGIDLSPIQPVWIPPNVSFMVDDAESEWLHGGERFDYIHIRHMCSSIRNWRKLLEQAYRALRPGGWIELQELRFVALCDDDTLAPDHVLPQLLGGVRDGLAANGINLLDMEKNASRVRQAGFVGVDEKVFKTPVGTWPRNNDMKKIGMYCRSMIYDGLHGITMGPFTRGLRWTPEEVEVFLAKVRKGLLESRAHVYIPFHVVMGQKPRG